MANNINGISGISAYKQAVANNVDLTNNAGKIHLNNEDEKVSFSKMLGNMFDSAKSMFQKSESMGDKAIHKQASSLDLVTAVSEAEVALNTIVKLREELIKSYFDIVKMQM